MKHPLLKLLLAIVVIASIGCANIPHGPQTFHQRYEAGCIGAGTAYGVITAINNVHPLKASQQARVLKAKSKIDDRCKLAPGADYPYSGSDAILAEVEAAAGDLKAVEGEVK